MFFDDKWPFHQQPGIKQSGPDVVYGVAIDHAARSRQRKNGLLIENATQTHHQLWSATENAIHYTVFLMRYTCQEPNKVPDEEIERLLRIRPENEKAYRQYASQYNQLITTIRAGQAKEAFSSKKPFAKAITYDFGLDGKSFSFRATQGHMVKSMTYEEATAQCKSDPDCDSLGVISEYFMRHNPVKYGDKYNFDLMSRKMAPLIKEHMIPFIFEQNIDCVYQKDNLYFPVKNHQGQMLNFDGIDIAMTMAEKATGFITLEKLYTHKEKIASILPDGLTELVAHFKNQKNIWKPNQPTSWKASQPQQPLQGGPVSG